MRDCYKMDELKKKTLVGSFWMLIERFGYLSIQFISNLVLARLLMPEDFGVIGIMIVFITLSNVFVDSGFSAALIQKKDISDVDKSTVFFTNLVIASIIYGLLFISSPIISNFFHVVELSFLLRILGLILIIDAFCAIQNTLFIREMNFKTLTKVKLFSIFLASFISIILAYNDYGIYSLIVQYLLYSTTRTVTTWIVSKWKPMLTFSMNSFRILFAFGSKLLVSNFIAEIYVNFQQILIGRLYKPSDLGFYSQARQFQQIPTGTISQVINAVAFPVYSKLQTEKDKLRNMFRNNIQLVAFFNTPLMVLLAVIAHPLIVLLYSTKWIGSIGYFQFLCIGFGILLVIHQCTLSVLKALGRSDYVLKLEIIKKIVGIFLIIFGIIFVGIWGILYALAINSVIELFLNGYYLNRELAYSGLNQLKDMLPAVILSMIVGAITYCILIAIYTPGNELVIILIISLLFILLYYLIAFLFRIPGVSEVNSGLRKISSKIKI